MALSPKTLQLFAGLRLDDASLGRSNFNYTAYPGLEVTVSQAEYTIPAATTDFQIVFPLVDEPATLFILPQYDAKEFYEKIYQQGLDPDLQSWPLPLTYTINVNSVGHALDPIKLATAQQYWGDYNLLKVLGQVGGVPTIPSTWFFTNPDPTTDQAVRLVSMTFVDFTWKNS